MGKVVRLFVFLLVLFSMRCVMSMNSNEDYETYANQVVKTFAQEMKNKYGLICIGDGGRMPHDIEKISVEFIAYKKGAIDEARKLEVAAIESLKNLINSDEKIRPFLREFPFTVPRIEVAISFRKRKDNDVYDDGSVARVTKIRNKLHYCANDSSKGLYVPLFEESYPEALKKVQAASQH